MSDFENKKNNHCDHGSFIKTPKQLVLTVILGFAIPITAILLLAFYVVQEEQVVDYHDAAVAKRFSAENNTGTSLAGSTVQGPRVYKTGEEIFKAVCAVCHTTGVAGAPKINDAIAWAPHIRIGEDHLLEAVLKGKGAMPARAGTRPEKVSDYELHRAMVYMINKSGGHFAEPTPPESKSTEPAK